MFLPFVNLCLGPFLRIIVFLHLAIAIGKSGHIPYAEIESRRLSVAIAGISKPIEFHDPKTYKMNQLQYLLDSKDDFQLTGMALLLNVL